MRPFRRHCVLLLTLLAVGSSGQAIRAEDMQELARKVRWRHLTLNDSPPDDLTVDVPQETSKLRFAEWVFGTPDSPRVAIAVAELENGQFALYVDRNRDRRIRRRELVKSSGALRMLPLAAQQVVGDVFKNHPRTVLLRWKEGEEDLSVATATFIVHMIHPDGDETARALKTRQVDGNANGQFADTKDLLQIDLNHDDRFDPFLETFPFRPVVKVRGGRWFTKADRFGKRLRLESATATGRLQVVTHPRSKSDRITDQILTLSGEDGSVYSLTGAKAVADLPVGRYAASVLFVAIKPNGTDRAWEFTFSRNGKVREAEWLQVSEGQTVEFDPIGELVLDAVVERPKRKNSPNLRLQPRLLTGSGLLINLCRISGKETYAGPQCQGSLTDAAGLSLGQFSSGFV